jgi:hypothetical protein
VNHANYTDHVNAAGRLLRQGESSRAAKHLRAARKMTTIRPRIRWCDKQLERMQQREGVAS